MTRATTGDYGIDIRLRRGHGGCRDDAVVFGTTAPLASLLQGLSFVIVSLPMLMLSWYLWAINDIVRKIQASPGTPAQQLAEVKGTLGPIMALLKMTEKASASAKMEV
jgi:hypothetical protein